MLALQSAYTTAQLKISLVPFYTLEVICSVIFAIAMLLDAVDYIRGIFNKDIANELCSKF